MYFIYVYLHYLTFFLIYYSDFLKFNSTMKCGNSASAIDRLAGVSRSEGNKTVAFLVWVNEEWKLYRNNSTSGQAWRCFMADILFAIH